MIYNTIYIIYNNIQLCKIYMVQLFGTQLQPQRGGDHLELEAFGI